MQNSEEDRLHDDGCSHPPGSRPPFQQQTPEDQLLYNRWDDRDRQGEGQRIGAGVDFRVLHVTGEETSGENAGT